MTQAVARRHAPSYTRRGIALGGSAVLAGGAYTQSVAASDEYLRIAEASLPSTYDAEAIATVWNSHPRCAAMRLVTITRALAPIGVRLIGDVVLPHWCGESTDDVAKRHSVRASALREKLVQLGPTFIKFGQMLSIRPDVLPPAALYELQKLCDSVPSYPTAAALLLIEAEIGRPVSDVFIGLDRDSTPVAAASLGQVYRCHLREGGHEIALKVQRPDMIRAVSLDLFLMRKGMQVVEWFKARVLVGLLGAADRTPFDVKLLDMFARASYLELDYNHEGANLERFASGSAKAALLGGRVRVPVCHWAVTTRKVIATEWINGEQLAKSPPEVINRLIPTGVGCFLCQLLEVGFFHSDPHPGSTRSDGSNRALLEEPPRDDQSYALRLRFAFERVHACALVRQICSWMSKGDSS